jgi:hypothetical protein
LSFPITVAFSAVAFGLLLLVLSADRFVEASASTARHIGLPPLLIGMVIVGFGTSAPEMVVSALAAAQGNSGIALGNAYGSNLVINRRGFSYRGPSTPAEDSGAARISLRRRWELTRFRRHKPRTVQ